MAESPIVVFDLGGVVVRICRSWKEACGRAGQQYHDITATPENIAERKKIVKRHEVGLLSDQDYYAQIAGTTGGLYTPDQVCTIHESWTIGEYAGIDRLVDDLHAAGISTGVLSNTNPHHWRLLMTPAEYPTIARMHHVHASHLLKHAKPDAAIFNAFCEVSGHAPHRVIFFDDLPDNVAGAQAAGWDAVQIDHTGDTVSQMRLHLRLRGIDV